MPDYKEMYNVLFRETTKAISALQAAQQRTEAMFIEDERQSSLIELKSINPQAAEKSKSGEGL